MDTSLNRLVFPTPTTIATSEVRTPDLRGHVSHLTYYPFMYFNLRNEDTSIKRTPFPPQSCSHFNLRNKDTALN